MNGVDCRKIHDQTCEWAVNIAGRTIGVAALMQTSNSKSGINSHILNVFIAYIMVLSVIAQCHIFLFFHETDKRNSKARSQRWCLIRVMDFGRTR